MISRLLIQKQAGEFVSPNGYAAWRGFSDRGRQVDFFDWPSLRDGAIAIDPSTLFVGGAGAILHVLKRLGITVPTIEDLPEPLRKFRGRRVWHSSLGEIRSQYNDEGTAIFIKPLRDPKSFPARTVKAFRDLISISHLPDEMPLLISEVVDFLSEWRFFVLRGQVVGAGWYAGSPLLFPNPEVIAQAVETWGRSAPSGYGIDFGVTADGRTLLVEVNEGYSLGCLGLAPITYSQILEARWANLVAALGSDSYPNFPPDRA